MISGMSLHSTCFIEGLCSERDRLAGKEVRLASAALGLRRGTVEGIHLTARERSLAGVIDTPWWDVFPDDQKQAMFETYAAKSPVGRVGRPEDVAKAIAFLIADSFMTGHVLICDGGLRLAA
jgi:NAD(P)-dependent dehydrogenase (short-subunit alcohol dehydrogenase family)